MDNNTNTLRILDIKTLTRPVRRNWFVVLVCFVSVIATVAYMTFTAEPVYEASATLSIRDTGDMQKQIFNIPSILTQKSLINNQVAHLQSRTLAGEVVQRLQTSPYGDSLDLIDVWPKNRVSFKSKIMAKLGMPIPQPSKATFQDLVLRFQRSIKIAPDPESDVIVLRARASKAWEAAVLVNTWVEAYQAYSQADTRGEVIQTKRFLETKLREIETKLDEAEAELANYQKREKVVALSSETQQLVEQASAFQAAYDQTRTDLDAVEQELLFLKGQLAETHANLVNEMDVLSTPAVQALQRQIADLEASKAAKEAMLLGAGMDYRKNQQLVEMDSRLQGLKQKLNSEIKRLMESDLSALNPLDRSVSLIEKILELETDQKSLVARQSTQNDILNEYNRRLEGLPEKSLKLADLERNVQVNDKIYLTLRENYEQIKIREAGQIDIVRVLDYAQPPKTPVLPKKGRNLAMGLFFGLLLGVGLAFSKDYFEDAVRDTSDLASFNLRILGSVIQYYPQRKLQFRRHARGFEISRAKSIYPYLLSHKQSHSSMAEAYRSIRTALYFVSPERPWKTLLVTSGSPSEGKSTTAANIAIIIAQKGVKTLLIDADLRRPVIDILFTGSHRKVGLSNVLGKEVDWRETVRETAIKGLSVMGAGMGVKNASELISSSRLPQFLAEVKKHYGAIIFDSAPVLPVTDAVVLSSLMDGVILVVKANQTSRDSVAKSLRLLRDVRAKIFGAIITGLKRDEPYGYEDYYSAYAEPMPRKTTAHKGAKASSR